MNAGDEQGAAVEFESYGGVPVALPRHAGGDVAVIADYCAGVEGGGECDCGVTL